MKTKRLNDISYLRSFAIIAIVLYHSYCPYMGWHFVETDLNSTYNSIFNIWLNARMPLFLFISGFLFSHLIHYKGKYQSYSEFILNKAKRLIIPYLAFACLLMLSHHNLSWNRLFSGYWHLWFLLMLFWSFIITWPMKNIKKPLVHLLLLISFTLSHFYAKLELDFGIKHLAYYYIWFYWGFVVVLYKEKLGFIFTPKAVIMSILIWITTSYVIDAYYLYSKDLTLLIAYMSNLSFIFSMFISTHLLIKMGILKEHPFINTLNKNSYGIYIAHIFIITSLFNGGTFINVWVKSYSNEWPIIFPLLLFTVTFASSLIISNYFLKTKFGRFLIG